ncbi:MAG: hypothetical protein P8N09_05745 [Planctomycetota bacterium]|jgi:hypothetical protein|nr:hypothetical protein [Planctomycetota bacterium]
MMRDVSQISLRQSRLPASAVCGCEQIDIDGMNDGVFTGRVL